MSSDAARAETKKSNNSPHVLGAKKNWAKITKVMGRHSLRRSSENKTMTVKAAVTKALEKKWNNKNADAAGPHGDLERTALAKIPQ